MARSVAAIVASGARWPCALEILGRAATRGAADCGSFELALGLPGAPLAALAEAFADSGLMTARSYHVVIRALWRAGHCVYSNF